MSERFTVGEYLKTGPDKKPIDEKSWRVIDTLTGGRLPEVYENHRDAAAEAKRLNERQG